MSKGKTLYDPTQTIDKKCIHHNRSIDPVDVPMPGGGVFRTVGIYTTVARCPICSSYGNCTRAYKLTGDEFERHRKFIENYNHKKKGTK